MTNTLNKIMHNGDEYKFPWISNSTEWTTSTVSNIRVWTTTEYWLITPVEWQVSIVYKDSWGWGWQPWANTIWYRPLETDLKDYSWNNYDFTTYSWTTTFVNWMVQTNWKISRNNVLDVSNNFTLLMYIVPNSDNNAESYLFFSDNNNLANANFGYWFWSYRLGWVVNWTREWNYYSASLDWNPHLLCVTKNWNSYDLYLDGVFAKNETTSVAIPSSTYMVLWNVTSNTKTMKFWKLIIEDRIRTDIEISNYYDQTKSTYWIS